MKRSVVLVTLATLLLAALAYGQEAPKPAKEAPPPDQRIFLPAVANLERAYGEPITKRVPVLLLGTINSPTDPNLRAALSDEAQSIVGDEARLAEMVRPVIQGYYANLKEEEARNLAAEAVKVLVRGTCPPVLPRGGSIPASAVGEAVMRMMPSSRAAMFLGAWAVERAEPVTSEIPVCQVLLISNEPELGLEIVSSLCQEVARELTGSELRFAQDALPKAKATLEEAAKKQAKLEPRRKELEEKYKFNVRGVGDKDDVYVGDAEFTGPLRDKLAKLQELQFGNDLRSASVQAQLDYVRTALAKERQDLRLGSGGPSEPFIAINPAWTSLKQRLVELETESIGLKATGDRLKQVLTETQGALNDATEYLTLEKTLRQATTEASQAKAEYESLQTIVTRIESAGPLPLPYVVRSWLPIPDRPGLIRQPVVKPVPAPNP